jgi:2-phospho-L-lactate transferase/gluconeogenesis factor (CofD/UPF0052 family)
MSCRRGTNTTIIPVMNADLVIVCPSNPIVSIGTILSVNGMREALHRTEARKVAISPIVAGAPIKGPAGKLLKSLGLEVSAYSAKAMLDKYGQKMSKSKGNVINPLDLIENTAQMLKDRVSCRQYPRDFPSFG